MRETALLVAARWCCAVAVSLVFTASASGCQCITIGDGLPELSSYEAVFAGRVLLIKDILLPRGGMPDSGRPMRLAVFMVNRSWRGLPTAVQSMYTGFGGGDCGSDLEEGQSYVVFAKRLGGVERELFGSRDRTLYTDICTPTAPVEAAQDLLGHLDAQYRSWSPAWKEWPLGSGDS